MYIAKAWDPNKNVLFMGFLYLYLFPVKICLMMLEGCSNYVILILVKIIVVLHKKKNYYVCLYQAQQYIVVVDTLPIPYFTHSITVVCYSYQSNMAV